jgi:hypothetical protein
MKLDLPKLESYSQAFAEKICAEYYQGDRAFISGLEILKLTSSEQVNYFILKNLFERWKEESAKLRSPFFDFEQEEVREALTVFMNKLSKHINVRKEFFKPLVVKGVSDSLAYLNQPLEFLKVEFCQKPILTLQEVKEKEKYFRVNKVLIQNFYKKLHLTGKTGFSKEEALSSLQEVYKNFEMSLEPSAKYLEQVQATLRLPTEESSLVPEEKIVESKQVKPETIVKEEPVVVKEVKVNTYKSERPPFETEKNQETLNDFFSKGKQLTLNEGFVHPEEENLLSKSRKSKIHDLKTAVPINLRYIFINELFKGSADDYNLAITQVERCDTLEAASNIIEQLYVKKYDWKSDKSEVKEFLELVERRFY